MHNVFNIVWSFISSKKLFRKYFKAFNLSNDFSGMVWSYNDGIWYIGGIFDIDAIHYGPSISFLDCWYVSFSFYGLNVAIWSTTFLIHFLTPFPFFVMFVLVLIPPCIMNSIMVRFLCSSTAIINCVLSFLVCLVLLLFLYMFSHNKYSHNERINLNQLDWNYNG